MYVTWHFGQLIVILWAVVQPMKSVEVITPDQSSSWSTLFANTECTIGIQSSQTGKCECNQLLDIRCQGLDQVPVFLPDERIYSSIHMADQGITNLSQAAFSGLKVRKIVLNFNAIGDRMSTDAWSGLGNVLHELQLAECRIPTLTRGLLHEMTELRHLHLWNNKISSIAQNFFKDCKNLRELLLWGNRIERIDRDTFAGLWELRRLDLDRNQIRSLSKEAFKHLRYLEVIHLGENRIKEIPSDTFQFVHNLKVLSLDGNGLEHIFDKAFQGLNNLLSLALQNNNIAYLPAKGAFINMSRLSTLLLHRNQLEMVWSTTFTGLRSLTRLDLADNKLTSLPDGMLQKSAKLRHVYLDNNRLKTMKRCVLSWSKRMQQTTGQSHLRTLSLMGNPSLSCDCLLTWLVDFREREGVNVWGTCAKTRHVTTPLSVIHRPTYNMLGCSFTQPDCKQGSRDMT